MKQQDFRNLIAASAIDRVILHRRHHGQGYELWAFGDRFPDHLSNRLKVARPDQRPGQAPERTWTSLDRAIGYIREQGWKGTVEVEEPVPDTDEDWQERYQTDASATDANWQAYRARITG
jgi:hypothetical protein